VIAKYRSILAMHKVYNDTKRYKIAVEDFDKRLSMVEFDHAVYLTTGAYVAALKCVLLY